MSNNVRRSVGMRLTQSGPSASATALIFMLCSPRAANNLRALPRFLLAVERCALTCVASIICMSVARARPASSRNRFSKTPGSQRIKRL